jgi:GT2 family glycosyltransferase
MLAIEGIDEVIVVDDGSTDDTVAFLRTVEDRRVRTVENGRRLGQPAARNRGADATTADWILYGEDDCYLPSDYALVLHREAVTQQADIVGAPWLNVEAEKREQAFAAARAAAVSRFELSTHPSTFPSRPLRTPFLPALALIRRDVLQRVRYYEGLQGNAYREETDFFISAVRAGFVCVLTPATASYQAIQTSGGARSNPLLYEYWAARNNWTFLRRNAAWLRAEGHIGSVVAAESRFVAGRVAAHVAPRVQAWRDRVIRSSLGS